MGDAAGQPADGLHLLRLAELLLAALQRALGAQAFRDVLVDAHESGDLAGLSAQRRARNAHVDQGPVATLPDGLYPGQPASRAGLGLEQERLFRRLRWNARERAPEHLGFGPAEHPFRRAAPAPDGAVGIERDDGERRGRHQDLETLGGAPQLLLGCHSCGDVRGKHEARGTAAVLHLVRPDLDRDRRAVPLSMPKDAGDRQPWPSGPMTLQEGGDFPRWPNLPQRHREKFLPGEPVVGHGRIVYLEKRQRLQIVDPHGPGIPLEQEAIPLFGGLRDVPAIAAPPRRTP